jgi:hypothetical protein
VTRRRGRRRKQLLYDLEERRGCWKLKGGNNRSHSVENSLRKRLQTFSKTDFKMNDIGVSQTVRI